MFDPKQFAVAQPKPLLVYLLLDVSTTMGEVEDSENLERTGETFFKDGKQWEVVEGGTTKMEILNESIKKMLVIFSEEEKMETEILVSIITFGDDAKLIFPPTQASDVAFENLIADGETSMGAALKMTKDMIEDKTFTPSRAYRPTIVLVSDGYPNDDWQAPLNDFINSDRSSKCDRMAMAIGKEADKKVLEKFIEGTDHSLFFSDDADKISDFFKYVTMSVTTRSRSQNPNQVPNDKDIAAKSENTKTKPKSQINENKGDEFDW